jgi:hypothetical protein
MKWIRKIFSAEFIAEKEKSPPQTLNVFISGSWGVLHDIKPNGCGYIKFKDGSGQIIRNWDHFFELISQCETESLND